MARSTTTGRKLRFFDALPPFLGGKRRLVGVIFREIDRVVPRRYWSSMTLLDAFMGGGSVGLFGKAQGFGRVVGTDLALRSVIVGQALLVNSRVKLIREDVVRILGRRSVPGPVERQMVPTIFTQPVARTIDNALALAAESDEEHRAALLRLLAIRVALLAHPYSQIRKGTAHRLETGELEDITPKSARHYVDAWRLATVHKLWALAQTINEGVFEGRAEVCQGDVVNMLPHLSADIMYADPPYEQVMSYEKQYEVLDHILEGQRRPTSPFTVKGGAQQIDRLLERATHIPVWVLSFGNAARSLSEIEEKMKHLGRETKAIEIAYQHLPAVATAAKNEGNREFLVVGWDPAVALFRDVGTPKERSA